MPRITEARREARRAEIVAAARRCFSRDGFHKTSMPDIAKEAGVSVGAPYRYFSGKEEIILELAGDAFRLIFEPVERLVGGAGVHGVADLVSASVDPAGRESAVDAAGRPVHVDELLRCAVQAWGELLTNEGLRRRAVEGFEAVRRRMAEVLRRGQAAGTVPAELDAERGTRVVMALLHGFVLQRVAFGLDDTEGFVQDIRAALTDAGVHTTPATRGSGGRGCHETAQRT
ncbi:TetR/AcrR family transcriptional regulator [Streptomyces sp. TP-A0356]|uniref:TetR/AcrR family transcriptional regulator n=1 Tax=Streptomyces sp. TP-A0356 TaxID=1359208 RepID=UPI0006E23127|nr:TetR/AcrR family transcriptional regulator [Streptomyces sp. TP-A0356]